MKKIGLIAGSGELPLEFAKNVSEKGLPLEIFAIKRITDKSIQKYGKTHWINFGEAQKLIDLMKENDVSDVVMLGKIEHYSLIFSLHKLDKRARQFFSALKDRRAKTILEAVLKELEKEGFNPIDPTPYLEHLLVPKGLINNVQPTRDQLEDVKFGFDIAKQIADLDIGQTVVVKNKIVIAVEGIEGTDKCIPDKCILRGGELGGEGTVVCKSARKNQDMRFDVPVVGLKTLKSMKKAKAKVLGIESGKLFLLDRHEFIRLADKYGISVIGL